MMTFSEASYTAELLDSQQIHQVGKKSTKPEACTNLPLWGCRDRGGRDTNHKPTDSFGAFNFNFNFNVSRNRKLTCSAR